MRSVICQLKMRPDNKLFTMIRMMLIIVFLFSAVSQTGLFAARNTTVSAGEKYPRDGRVSVGSSASVRELPSTKSSTIDSLFNNHPVTVLSEVKGEFVSSFNTDIWYSITYRTTSGSEKSGFMLSSLIVLDPLEPAKLNPEFEKYLDEQGFPESYRPKLRALKTDYPEWRFTAMHVDMTWEAAVNGQARSGVSLIENAVNDNWKTIDPAGYNWLENRWIIYDSDRWVMASKNVIAYYMDPRNMLTPSLIFQFENLSYCHDAHTHAGVANILNNTFMSVNNTFDYEDKDGTKKVTYVDTFMEAASISNVSPYHLASRVVQEVGVNGSASVSGTYRGYEGLYNFFNIGASSSSDPVARGLEYAKYGPLRRPVDSKFTEAQLANLEFLLIPWDNRFDSIIGGSKFLGRNYINRNQNTLYLQRFNLLASSYPSHQYMTNIRAIAHEATRLARGYINQDAMNNTIEFIIPVFKEMPEQAALMPAASGNPNNWIKTLLVDGRSVTPSFNPEKRTGYSIIVDTEIREVEINATPVSLKARINKASPGAFKQKFSLDFGENDIELVVTAENGSKRTYQINVVRTPPDPDVLFSDIYKINEAFIFGFDPGKELNKIEKIVANMKVPEHYQMRIVDKEGKPVEDIIATGHKIELMLADTVVDSFTAIVYGDTNGNGRISSADLNNVLNHILRRQTLEGPYAIAADVDKNERISSSDINHILNHILKKANISQN